MTLDQIKFFITSIDTGSISAAAEELHLSQPNLSVALKSLESEIGCQLLSRSRHGILPTEAGKKAYDICKSIISETDELQKLGKETAANANYHLNISSINSVNVGILPSFINSFMDEHPNVQISVNGGATMAALQDLNDDKCDMAIVVWPNSEKLPSSFIFEPLFENKLMVCVGAELAKELTEPISYKALEKFPFLVFMHRDSILYKNVTDKAFNGETPFHPSFTTSDIHLVKQMVAQNHGFCILNTLAFLEDHMVENGEIIPMDLQDSPSVTFYAVFKKDVPPSKITKSFVRKLKEASIKTIKEHPSYQYIYK